MLCRGHCVSWLWWSGTRTRRLPAPAAGARLEFAFHTRERQRESPFMCRMIAFVGDGSADLAALFAAFQKGSQNDPYVQAALGKYTCHPHGWGYAIYDGTDLHHFRSSHPVWQEEVALPRMKGSPVYAIFHSRLASDETLNTPICSHPFITSTDKEVLLMAHNGGLKVEDDSAGRIVDSEWALSVIAKAGSMEEGLQRLKKLTRSALNLLLLRIPRDGNQSPSIHCLNFFKSNQPERIAYYQMFTADFAGGKVVLSSTFKDLPSLQNVQIAPFDRVFSIVM
jgi:predicted glutamine amidotransferase